MNLDTYEIQLDATGQEAVQQTLDALGVKAESINAEVGGQRLPRPEVSNRQPSTKPGPRSFHDQRPPGAHRRRRRTQQSRSYEPVY